MPLDKTYRPAEVEAALYAEWERSGAFAAAPNSPRKPYCIMMPPPNVTGSLHMGHALNGTLQDVLTRYHRMRGHDALWQPGMDHAGIATQMVVERQLEAAGTNRRTLGREAFVQRVWEWKAESGGTITRQFRRLGASPDWPRERFTMDEGLSAAVRKVFVDLYKQKLIYRDKRLVNWDPRLHTAISDLEVEQREVKGTLWHIRYPIDGDAHRFIAVATTRPETLLGDTAVAVHPDDHRYRDLIGKFAILPIAGRRIPIVSDLHSDPEKGTGAVKITPAHDFNDFEVGRRHNLPMINIFDADARLNENAPAAYRGLERYEARRRILAELEEQGRLAAAIDHPHVVPHGDRSGVPIEPWLTDQWYVDAHTLAKPAIEAVESGRTVFVPRHWENTYFEWMRNIQPWCISRQLWWGHQIPAWYGPDGKVFVELTEEEAKAAAALHYGIETPIVRDPDVLDTWFSSALWPFSTLGWPQNTPEVKRYYPTDVLVTAFDIIFFWVARMMMMGLHFMGEVPFQTVYIHALVRDARGQKMSKSKGNVIDPLELIDAYGCDALRFTLAALAAPGRDIKLSAGRVEGYRNFATKLWNAARYCEMNACLPNPGFDPARSRLVVNRWIVGEAVRCGQRLERAFGEFRFNDAAAEIYQFVWGSFCDWYLEFTKPMLLGNDPADATEIRGTTGWVLDRILRLLHPIMPFVTEELWSRLSPPSGGRLIAAPWPEDEVALIDADASLEMEWVVKVVSEIRAVRSEMNVPAAARLTLRVRESSSEAAARLDRYRAIILTMARLDDIEHDPRASGSEAAQIVLSDATLLLPLSGHIDVAKQRGLLGKERDKLAGEIAKIDAKLANAGFLAKAPEEVVEEQRERRAEAEATRAKLAQALDRLSV